jgi:hypothetical protein
VKYSILISWWCVNCCFSFLRGEAQVQQTNRFEIPLTGPERTTEVIPLHDRGLLIQKQFIQSKTNTFEILKLDTAYQESWRGVLALDQNFTIAHKRYFNSKLYTLARHNNYYDFQLLVLDVTTGNYLTYQFRNYIPFLSTEFEVNSKGAIIGSYYNRIPIVVFFDFETLRIKILPGLFSETGELSQIKLYPDNTFDVLLCARYFNREKTVWIKSYSPEGDFLNQMVIPVDGNRNLLFGRVLRTADNMKVVAGVFGNRNSEYSKGFFMASIDPFGYQQIKYYNFADLENFFGYMKDKREQRVKSRIERRKLSGKKIRFNYRLLVDELIPYQDQFIILGEAFYPKYKTSDQQGYSGFFYGRNSMQGYDQIFDGYLYTHAMVLGFNTNGELLWDNSFEMNDIKTFELQQFVKLKADEDKLTLLYAFDNQLRTKTIRGKQVVEGKSAEPIKTLVQGDVDNVDNTTVHKLEYWYGDYLVAYGQQNIVNVNEKGEESRRSVFFINKVKCK